MRKWWFAAAVGVPTMVLSYPQIIPHLSDWLPKGSAQLRVVWALMGVGALAVLVYSGSQFLSGAREALRHRQANMHTLIAMGTGVAWLYSSVALAAPGIFPDNELTDVYYDVTVVALPARRPSPVPADGRGGHELQLPHGDHERQPPEAVPAHGGALMTAAQILVTLAGAIAFVVWFFWLKRQVGTRAALTPGGWQEQMVLVKGGYIPDTILAVTGRPLRLVFQREEASPCSETVVFDGFGRSAQLPRGKPTTVELMPTEPGEYPFSCQMAMLRGRLIIEAAR